jgi:hypothetical protein
MHQGGIYEEELGEGEQLVIETRIEGLAAGILVKRVVLVRVFWGWKWRVREFIVGSIDFLFNFVFLYI